MKVVSHLTLRFDEDTSNLVGGEGNPGVHLSAAVVVRGVIPREGEIDVVVIHQEEAGVAVTAEAGAIVIAEEDVRDPISLHLQSQDLAHDLPKAIVGNTTSMKVEDFINQVVAGIITTTLLEMAIVAIGIEETIESTIVGLIMIDGDDRIAVRSGRIGNSGEEILIDVVDTIKPSEKKCVDGKMTTMKSLTNSCSKRLESHRSKSTLQSKMKKPTRFQFKRELKESQVRNVSAGGGTIKCKVKALVRRQTRKNGSMTSSHSRIIERKGRVDHLREIIERNE